MFYENELRLLRDTLRKYCIQTNILDWSVSPDEKQELGIYLNLTQNPHNDVPLANLFPILSPTTIHRMTDAFSCRYLYMSLPELSDNAVLVIGPYLCAPFNWEAFQEKSESLEIQPAQKALLQEYYTNLPVMVDSNPLLMVLDTFCEHIWGINNYSVEDIDKEIMSAQWILPQEKSTPDVKNTLLNIHQLEQRYAFENEMMEAVSHGQAHKADIMLSTISGFSFEQRLADPVRNIKNYCIIMNTLLRTAAEKGGVHPIYLDNVSGTFAAKIEQMDTTETAASLLPEMFRDYCRIVRQHSMKNYSPLTQKAVTFIDTDLAADLNLRTISKALNISSSYLSTSFKKETGQTITDYINHRRISHAKHLLRTTSLQVQTVAQLCGIVDVHYFSKVFKKIVGITPKQYRQSHD